MSTRSQNRSRHFAAPSPPSFESMAEFSELLLGPDSGFASAIGQLAAVCLQLQSIADDNDIEADLLECAG